MLAIFLLHCWQCIVCVQALAELLVEEHNRGLNAAMTHPSECVIIQYHQLVRALLCMAGLREASNIEWCNPQCL